MSAARPVNRLRTVAALALMAGALGWSGCDDSSRPLELQFEPADTLPSPDRVRLVGTDRAGQMMTIQVVVDGPTTSGDLSTFDFGVQIGDDTIVEYVPGSETLGAALPPTGCADVQLLATARDEGLVVTVAKIGCPGNAVLDPGTVLMTFDVRVLRVGATAVRLGPIPFNNPPVALDSTPAAVPSIVFDPAPIIVFGL